MILGGVNLMCTFRGDVEIFTPIWSPVNENEKKITKVYNLKFWKTKRGFEIWRTQNSQKFGIDSLDGF